MAHLFSYICHLVSILFKCYMKRIETRWPISDDLFNVSGNVTLCFCVSPKEPTQPFIRLGKLQSNLRNSLLMKTLVAKEPKSSMLMSMYVRSIWSTTSYHCSMSVDNFKTILCQKICWPMCTLTKNKAIIIVLIYHISQLPEVYRVISRCPYQKTFCPYNCRQQWPVTTLQNTQKWIKL